LEDCRISAKSIAEQLGISREWVGSIIHEYLDMRKVTKGVLFLLDNAPAHQALASQKKLAYLGFQCLDHPPYSLDLVPSDYHLFPELKKQLKGRHFLATRRSLLPQRPGWMDNLLNFS
jgi:DNA-binding Lrp family transcriptional regulator